MTYNQFLHQFESIFSFFANYLKLMANSLIHNYFFITLLGICIFISLFWLVYNFIHNHIMGKIYDIERKEDLYKDYCLKQDIVFRWRNEHRLRVYQLAYDKYSINKHVSNEWIVQNRSLANEYSNNRFKILIPSYKNTEKFYQPDWLDKEPEKKPLSKAEKEEIDKLIDTF